MGFLLLSSKSSSGSPALMVANAPQPSAYNEPVGGSYGLAPQASYNFDLSPDAFFGNDLKNYQAYQSQKDAEQESAIMFLAEQLKQAYAQGATKEDTPFSIAFDAPHEQSAFNMLGTTEKAFEQSYFAQYVKEQSSGGSKKSGFSMSEYQKSKTAQIAKDLSNKQKAKSPGSSKLIKSALSNPSNASFIFGGKK